MSKINKLNELLNNKRNHRLMLENGVVNNCSAAIKALANSEYIESVASSIVHGITLSEEERTPILNDLLEVLDGFVLRRSTSKQTVTAADRLVEFTQTMLNSMSPESLSIISSISQSDLKELEDVDKITNEFVSGLAVWLAIENILNESEFKDAIIAASSSYKSNKTDDAKLSDDSSEELDYDKEVLASLPDELDNLSSDQLDCVYDIKYIMMDAHAEMLKDIETVNHEEVSEPIFNDYRQKIKALPSELLVDYFEDINTLVKALVISSQHDNYTLSEKQVCLSVLYSLILNKVELTIENVFSVIKSSLIDLVTLNDDGKIDLTAICKDTVNLMNNHSAETKFSSEPDFSGLLLGNIIKEALATAKVS